MDKSNTKSTNSQEGFKVELEKKLKIDPEAADQVQAQVQTLTPAQHAQAFPDGRREAWLTVAGSAACLFVSFGWVNCVGIFEEYYQTHQLKDYTPDEIAWIPSLMVFFMFFAGLLVGKVFDDNGPRFLLAWGTLLHVLGLMLTSVSTQYVQIILCQAVVSALGACMVFFPAVSCVSTWFRAKRGAAIGLVAGGSSLGGIVFPTMVTQLLPQVGFGWTMRICAFLILALLIFSNLTIKSRLPPSKRPFVLYAFFRPLKERTFALLSAAIFFYWWGMFIPIIFLVSDARNRGMSEHLSRYLVPIMNATSLIGRTVPNAMADKLGTFNVTIAMSLLTTALILGLLMPTSGQGALIAFTALFGVSSGAGIGLAPVLCAQVSPIQEIGARTGAAFSLAAFAALTGSPIGGRLISTNHGSFFDTFLFAGVSCAIGTILIGLARISKFGTKFGKI